MLRTYYSCNSTGGSESIVGHRRPLLLMMHASLLLQFACSVALLSVSCAQWLTATPPLPHPHIATLQVSARPNKQDQVPGEGEMRRSGRSRRRARPFSASASWSLSLPSLCLGGMQSQSAKARRATRRLVLPFRRPPPVPSLAGRTHLFSPHLVALPCCSRQGRPSNPR
jgi:hypothetical protein